MQTLFVFFWFRTRSGLGFASGGRLVWENLRPSHFSKKKEICRMVQMNVRSNYKKLARSLDDLGRKQLPFAFSRTLNETMFEVRRHVVKKTYPRAFDVRDRTFFTRIMTIDKSNIKRSAGLSVVLRDRKKKDYLEVHTKGGVKRPRGGGHLAIPSDLIKARRTGKGIRSTRRPRAIIASEKGFVGKTKFGAPVIYERKFKRKRYPLKVVYYLAPRARISKTFPFYKDANTVTRRVSPAFFRKNFAFALKTARR